MDRAREEIGRTLTDLKTFLAQESVPRLSEADTKAYFIEPILAALGWVGIGVVTREYYVKNSGEFIDYALFGSDGQAAGNAPVLAIEAKALQTDLTDKFAAQLIQYCAVEGIEWAALTNGRELQFFNTFLKPDLAAKRVMRLDLLAFNSDDEFDVLFEQLWQLSRESITTASVRTWLNQLRLDKAVREAMLNPGSSVITSLRKVLADAEVRATPQELVQWFRTHLVSPIPRVLGRPQDATSVSTAAPAHPTPDLSAPTRQIRQAGGHQPVGDTLCLALQAAVRRHIPEAEWRTTKSYSAAEIGGRTFLVVRTRVGSLVLGLSLPSDASHPRLSDNAGQISWTRMTKIVTIRSAAELDDELLTLVDAARQHALSGRTKAHYGVTLSDLVDEGILPAGTPLVLVSGGIDLARAEVSSTGEILWQGSRYRSLSDGVFCPLFRPGRVRFNGWTHWYAELSPGRVMMHDLRSAFLSRRSPDGQQAAG